jgi:hypothetical protein
VTVGDFASIAALALQNNNAQITSTTATTITLSFLQTFLLTLNVNPVPGPQGCSEHIGTR